MFVLRNELWLQCLHDIHEHMYDEHKKNKSKRAYEPRPQGLLRAVCKRGRTLHDELHDDIMMIYKSDVNNAYILVFGQRGWIAYMWV